jgi:hypothetical protein
VVVDSKGNVIPEDTGSDDLFNGALGGLDSLGTGSVAPGLDPGQFFGPALSDDDVTVGDTWSDEIDTPGMGDDPIVTTLNAQVTGTDQVDGVDVFVIDSTYTTTPIEFDLGDFFSGLFGAFLSDGTSTGDQAQLDDLMGELKFVISADGIESHVVSRFDPAGGLVRAAELTGGSHVGIDIALPDEATGELQSFQMSVKLAQSLSYQLLSGPQA